MAQAGRSASWMAANILEDADARPGFRAPARALFAGI